MMLLIVTALTSVIWLTSSSVSCGQAEPAGQSVPRQSPATSVEFQEAPLVGRPDDFSGVVGQYSISSQAAPTTVAVEEPITVLVSITGKGPKPGQPKRNDLHVFPADIDKSFYIEEVVEKDRQRDDTWEFVYRLRPKKETVSFIPSLKLVYFDPAADAFQTDYADAIEINVTVKPVLPVEPGMVDARHFGDFVVSSKDLPNDIFALRARLASGPGRCEIHDALRYARGLVRYPENVAPFSFTYEPCSFVRRLRSRWGAALGLAAIVGGYFGVFWYRRRKKWYGILAIMCVGAAACLTIIGLPGYDEAVETRPFIVVRQDGTALQEGNAGSYPLNRDMPSINRGMEARLVGKRGTWLHVQFENGVVGWIGKDSALVAE